MRVRCRATADYRSNAVGSVELECQPGGLCITLRGVSSYREGYAPGPPVHARCAIVPWPSVYATRIGEETLLLSVDARYLPQNRLRLAEFSDPAAEAEAGLSPARRLLILGSIGAVLLALAAALGQVRALPHPRALGDLAMAALLAALVLAIGVARSRRPARRSSPEVLRELSFELARRLPNHIPVEAATPPPRSFEPIDLCAFLPRSALGIAVTLAAAMLAALVGSSAARPSAPVFAALPSSAALRPAEADATQTPTVPRAAAGEAALPPAPLPSGAEDATGAAPQWGPPCECQREASWLWQPPRPRLATVLVSRQLRMHEGHQHTELELALVNDGAIDAERISLSVLFFEERSGARAGHWQTGERPFHFEGPLEPGGALKWHVEGRGTSFDVVAPDLGTLAPDGSDAAPADAFAALASDGPRAVRLHAARMLAFLGDGRARDAALAASPTASDGEGRDLARSATAPRDVIACQLAVAPVGANRWRLDACLFNRAPEARGDLELRLLASSDGLEASPSEAKLGAAGSPAVLAEHRARLELTLPPGTGRRLTLSAPLELGTSAEPRAFEVVVDRGGP